MLTWLLNDEVGNGLYVAIDVNVFVNDVNDVNVNSNASNVNTVADEEKLLVDQFPNISIGQILNWSEIFCLYL